MCILYEFSLLQGWTLVKSLGTLMNTEDGVPGLPLWTRIYQLPCVCMSLVNWYEVRTINRLYHIEKCSCIYNNVALNERFHCPKISLR